MPELALYFQIKLREDMHVGTGVGRLGIVDDTQSRDQKGRPVVWASTLRGLLREAGEDWLWALERASVNVTDCRTRMQRLLGRTVESSKDGDGGPSSPGSAIVRSLRLLDDCEVNRRGNRQEKMFVVWSSTAREPHSRRPNDQTLRQVEHAGAGLIFEGEIRLPMGDPDDCRLVVNLLRRVTALGGRRTRGSGEIELLADPQELQLCEKPPLKFVKGQTLRLLLRNLEPLNLAATALAGNLIGSQTYIPGTRLRAALLHWLSKRGQSDLAERLAGSMQVTNAYFVPGQPRDIDLANVTVLPLPLSLLEPKGGQGEETTDRLPWWATRAANGPGLARPRLRDAIACPLPKQENEDKHKDLYPERADFKRIKTEDYALRADSQWQRVRPKVGVLLRNMVPTSRRDGTEYGRSEGRIGKAELFSEAVLWEDQCFVAELCFKSEKDARDWQEAAAALLGCDVQHRSWLRLGRGGRPVVIEQCVAAPRTEFEASPGRLTLTLTSDLIARKPWLTFVTEPCIGDLSRLIEEADGGCVPTVGMTIDASFHETTEVYGFNSATGLPRAPAQATKRGSVFLLTGPHVGDWRAALRKVNALGERTADGFGRFVVDLPLHSKEYWRSAEAGDAAEPSSEIPDPAEEVLKKVNEFLGPEGWNLRNKKARELRGKGWPSVTQWQWLRTRVQVAENLDDELAALIAHARTLAGHCWGTLPQEIAAQLTELADVRAKKLFVNYLTQAVVAHMRRQRRRMEDRS